MSRVLPPFHEALALHLVRAGEVADVSLVRDARLVHQAEVVYDSGTGWPAQSSIEYRLTTDDVFGWHSFEVPGDPAEFAYELIQGAIATALAVPAEPSEEPVRPAPGARLGDGEF